MNRTTWQKILDVLPAPFGEMLKQQSTTLDGITELRIRCGKPIEIVTERESLLLHDMIPNAAFCSCLLQRLGRYSLYSIEDQIRLGYITVFDGVRVGICGHVCIKDEKIQLISPITSFCFRVARQINGCADLLLPHVFADGTCHNLLIVSPPGAGKTTMLRDVARHASYNGYHVVVLDERSEISGTHNAEHAFDLGPRCDVMDGGLKSQTAMLCLRSLSPDILVCDELGTEEDLQAMQEVSRCGIHLFASIHAASMQDIQERLDTRVLDLFSCVVFLSEHTRGVIQDIYHRRNKNWVRAG